MSPIGISTGSNGSGNVRRTLLTKSLRHSATTNGGELQHTPWAYEIQAVEFAETIGQTVAVGSTVVEPLL